jgi:hypothetical protein
MNMDREPTIPATSDPLPPIAGPRYYDRTGDRIATAHPTIGVSSYKTLILSITRQIRYATCGTDRTIDSHGCFSISHYLFAIALPWLILALLSFTSAGAIVWWEMGWCDRSGC